MPACVCSPSGVCPQLLTSTHIHVHVCTVFVTPFLISILTQGVVIKYSEPAEARIPKTRWRLYPFKGDQALCKGLKNTQCSHAVHDTCVSIHGAHACRQQNVVVTKHTECHSHKLQQLQTNNEKKFHLCPAILLPAVTTYLD